ncbi:NHL repeat-containing protein [Melioribacter sp. OK-6-Me]|uniref:NHL repeat-containing protein n=1 Tax=unclassified Melioribacter TaxID=2627329 RepID=UPI003EDA4B19
MSFLLFNITFIKAQTPVFSHTIGNFTSARSFSIDHAGSIYVVDISTNELLKIDSVGTIIKVVGGYGWDNYTFDFPADVHSTLLNVYVADKYNDRIQIFDKDLNYITTLSTYSSEPFRHPISVSVSNQGDVFLIDSDNSRLLKFTSDGQYLLEVGGILAGNSVLENPEAFSIIDNKIFVLDTQSLFIFDLWGNNIARKDFDFDPININATPTGLTINTSKNIYYAFNNRDLLNLEFKNFSPNISEPITDSILFDQKLYILTPKTIYVYKLVK